MPKLLNDINFEYQKNIKAAVFTALVVFILFLLFVLISWKTPELPPPTAAEGIEVNLGNSNFGAGDVEPQIPGSPSNTVQQPTPQQASAEPEANEALNDAGDVPVSTTKTTKTTKAINNNTVKTPTTKPAPVEIKKAKAVFGGATTKDVGGNKADSYNGVKNQGVTSGNENQGSPGGKVNSDTYKGNANSGNSGVSIQSGLDGRRLVKLPNFEDDFNENAKVAVDILVDANGKVLSATVNPRRTTTTNGGIRKIATNKAFQLKFNTANAEQNGTIIFNFKVAG